MRRRILRSSVAQRVADKRRELAIIICKEDSCSMTKAFRKLDFQLEMARI